MKRTLPLALLVLALAGCGGTSEPSDSTASSGGAETPAPSWDDVDLVTAVREGAVARIHEVEPGLDTAQIPAWAADPSAAPALGDRVSEQVIHLAIAAAAADEPDLAAGLVRLVREKARNRNNAYVGTTLLSELARRGAADDAAAREGIQAVFAELPRNRFGGATVVYQLFQNEGQIDARIERLHEQLVSLDTAVSALFYDAMRDRLGDRRFNRFWQDFLAAHRYGIVTEQDWLAAIKALDDPELVRLYERWVAGPRLSPTPAPSPTPEEGD